MLLLTGLAAAVAVLSSIVFVVLGVHSLHLMRSLLCKQIFGRFLGGLASPLANPGCAGMHIDGGGGCAGAVEVAGSRMDETPKPNN